MRLLVSGPTAALTRLLPTYREYLGFLMTPRGGHSIESVRALGVLFACDNDCFQGLNPERYRRMLAKVTDQPGFQFVAVPDCVGDAKRTLELFGEWAMEVRATGQPPAFVGQDGAEDLLLPWDDFDAYFVGGSTKWKLSQASFDLIAEAKRRGKWTHVGRVNSQRRLFACYYAGVDSCDGTGGSKFGDLCLPELLRWLKELHYQPSLFAGELS